MRRRARGFIGSVATLAFVVVYAFGAMTVAQIGAFRNAPALVLGLVYVALGLWWIFPLTVDARSGSPARPPACGGASHRASAVPRRYKPAQLIRRAQTSIRRAAAGQIVHDTHNAAAQARDQTLVFPLPPCDIGRGAVVQRR